MSINREIKTLFWISLLFLAAYFLPVNHPRLGIAIMEALKLLRWYAREHVLLCLVPAFFIAGYISVFVSQASVIKYFGAGAKKWVAYAIASVSGTVLAVCSCTILPLFSGIYKRGAGLGPAVAFLYSGPAINILAIILTARILGADLGLARIIGAVVFSIVIGLLMHFFFRKEEKEKMAGQINMPETSPGRPLWQTASLFFTLIAILVFANWGRPQTETGFWYGVWHSKWMITAGFGVLYALLLVMVMKYRILWVVLAAVPVTGLGLFFPNVPLLPFSAAVLATVLLMSRHAGEPRQWLDASWGFAKQILPLLGAGVLVAGLLLGSPGSGMGLIPASWIDSLVGGNSLFSNFFASIAGAFMYFATLTEVPIVQGLLANGMGKGPALALLLAGPALSLPNMLVIRSVLGTKKTVVFVTLVVVMATITGYLFGLIV